METEGKPHTFHSECRSGLGDGAWGAGGSRGLAAGGERSRAETRASARWNVCPLLKVTVIVFRVLPAARVWLGGLQLWLGKRSEAAAWLDGSKGKWVATRLSGIRSLSWLRILVLFSGQALPSSLSRESETQAAKSGLGEGQGAEDSERKERPSLTEGPNPRNPRRQGPPPWGCSVSCRQRDSQPATGPGSWKDRGLASAFCASQRPCAGRAAGGQAGGRPVQEPPRSLWVLAAAGLVSLRPLPRQFSLC